MKAEKQFQKLREKAEALLDEKGAQRDDILRKDFEEIVHELQIQQAELEIQNEELRRTQEDLTNARNRYARLYHHAPVGYALLDADGVIRDVNKTFCQALNLSPSDVLSRGLTSFIHPDDRHAFLSRYKSFFNRPDERGFELRIQPPQGWHRFYRVEGARLEGVDYEKSFPDCPMPLLVSFSDITARVEAQRKSDEATQELRELTNTFVTMLERTTDFLYFKDAKHRFTAVSQSMADLVGHENWRDMIGKTDHDVFPKELADTYFNEEKPVIEEGRPVMALIEPYRRLDGTDGWVSSNKWPVFDEHGVVVGLYGISRDVTEMVRIEQELKHKVIEFETIFDSSALATAYLKSGRMFHRVNKRFERLFGYTQDELVGRHVSILHVTPDDADYFGRNHYDELKKGGVQQVEYRLKTKDGRAIWCNLSGRAVNPSDLNDGVIWIIDDISGRKELEQLKADVDRIMIHDLRSPLSGIIGLPQAMQVDSNLTDEQKQLLRTIEQAGYRMLMQINLSLDLYKMETGKYIYKPKPINICHALDWVGQELASLAHAKGVRIKTTIGGKDIAEVDQYMVTADELLINTLLTNLVSNAVEASPFGSTVDIMLNPGETHHRLSIHNLGEVPEEVRDHFFSKYTTHGKDKGTGLGTYSAKLMTEAMGGRISMVTGENSGTTVTLILPETGGKSRS